MLFEKVNPMLLTKVKLVEDLFIDWEDVFVSPKIDGIRLLAHKQGGLVKLMTRTGRDVTEKFPLLVRALQQQPHPQFILDTELTAIDGNKILPFSKTLSALQKGSDSVRLNVFDAINIAGDIAHLPFSERLNIAQSTLIPCGELSFIPHTQAKNEGEIEGRYKQFLKMGFEGLVARDAYAPYEFKRSSAIRKLKPLHFLDLKIIGKKQGRGVNSYSLATLDNKPVGRVRDYRNFEIGSVVEVGYENLLESGKLHFPRIVRVHY